ncbi:hypothetical protein Ddc_01571 [Ditylenchus destructor]|nr:hypothetical protein Ddc_01571 [Ditylenchus destructor]
MFACFRDVYRSVRKGMGFKGKTYHDVKASHAELRQNEEQSIAQSVESAVAAPVDHSDYEGITSAAADSTDGQESVLEPNPSTEPVRTIFEDHRTSHQADSEDEDGGAPAVSVVIDEDEGPSATIGSGQNTTATESEESMPNIPYQDHNYDVGRPAVRTNTSRAYFGDNNEPFPYELLQASLDFLERPHLFQLATANDRIDSMIDYEFKTGSPYLILEKAELCYGFFPYEWGIKRKDKEFEYDSIPEMAVELQNSTFLRFKSARFFFQEHEINPLSIMKPISHTWKGGEVYISAQGPILSPDEFARTIATCKLLKMDSINALPILREILKADGSIRRSRYCVSSLQFYLEVLCWRGMAL